MKRLKKFYVFVEGSDIPFILRAEKAEDIKLDSYTILTIIEA